MSTTYIIEQGHNGHFEPLDNGEFDTRESAESAIVDLVTVCGWEASSMRIVEVEN